MKNILIKNALIYFIINLSNIALGQNNIEGVCSFVPVPMAGWYSYQVGGEPRIIGDADKSKSDWIKNIKNPKVMQLKIDGTNFEFAVGFDKFGNKWIVPYNFDKFQPYKDVPFVFNEICTEETIYLRLPRYKELQAFTLRRYFQEEKDKNGIGKSLSGKMIFDIGRLGYHTTNIILDSVKYKVNVWYDCVHVCDTLGNKLFWQFLNVNGPIMTINKKKYAVVILNKYKTPTIRFELATDEYLAKNKDLLTTTDFAKFGITNLDDKKISPIKDLVAKNDYTLVDFWGTWCGPCIAELPSLAEAYSQYKDKLPFISVAFDSDLEKIKPLMEKNGIVWQQYYLSKAQEKAQAEKYSINSFPTFMLIDKKGQVIYRSDRDDDKTTPLHKDKLLKMLKKYFP